MGLVETRFVYRSGFFIQFLAKSYPPPNPSHEEWRLADMALLIFSPSKMKFLEINHSHSSLQGMEDWWTYLLCVDLDISFNIFQTNFLTHIPHPWKVGVGEHKFCVLIWIFHFIPKHYLGKLTTTSPPHPWGVGVHIHDLLCMSGYVIQFLIKWCSMEINLQPLSTLEMRVGHNNILCRSRHLIQFLTKKACIYPSTPSLWGMMRWQRHFLSKSTYFIQFLAIEILLIDARFFCADIKISLNS